jgi:hypothetical protein
VGATYRLRNQAHYHKRKFHVIWYVSFYQIGLSSSDNIHSGVIDLISPLYPLLPSETMQEMLPIQSHSLLSYTHCLLAEALPKARKACQTTTMQSIWCNFVTRRLFGTLNYWKSQLEAILDLNFRRSEFFFPAIRPDLPTNIGCQIINPVYPWSPMIHTCSGTYVQVTLRYLNARWASGSSSCWIWLALKPSWVPARATLTSWQH